VIPSHVTPREEPYTMSDSEDDVFDWSQDESDDRDEYDEYLPETPKKVLFLFSRCEWGNTLPGVAGEVSTASDLTLFFGILV